ncbi:hypothetical protein [Roseibium aggregatum]|uniref:hypothetical protein n=1 Tax=Roseibium aggregatum TaxID=187304 RepID=UPI001E2A1B07|nr:hypothetical protein [Roseibium aggregatum]UES40922.1 hypothetical protein GFC08_25555 [Roseibium aggregatum]
MNLDAVAKLAGFGNCDWFDVCWWVLPRHPVEMAGQGCFVKRSIQRLELCQVQRLPVPKFGWCVAGGMAWGCAAGSQNRSADGRRDQCLAQEQTKNPRVKNVPEYPCNPALFCSLLQFEQNGCFGFLVIYQMVDGGRYWD